jgi:apolipoprotein N-acyltransferase
MYLLKLQKTQLLLPAHILCGVSLALALPPVSCIWLALCGLVGVTLLNGGPSTASRWFCFIKGLAFGLGYFGFALHWIGFAFLVDADSYLWMMPFAVGGLALLMAVYWGLAFVAARWMVVRAVPAWLALPLCLSVAEWLRGILFTGFPWAAPGLIADGMGPVLQMASVVGMPGLTFFILIWGMAAGAVVRRNVVAMLVVGTLPLCLIWGQWRLASAPAENNDGPLIRIVQPNISQNDKWRGENARAIFEELLDLSRTDDSLKAAAIIWPESAVPFLLDESSEALAAIAEVLEPSQVLLAGTLRRKTIDGDENYFTSIQLVDAQGVVRQSYDKWRLVPGGEFLPLAWALEPLGFRKVVDLPESFSAGEGPKSIDVPGIGLTAMLICYEAIFPDYLVDGQNRPRWIVNVTNDGWFGASVGPYQHLAQVRMRAVEQGLPLARAANTGVSAMIDPWGRYIARTKLETRDVLTARLPRSIDPPLFARWGVVIFWALWVLIGAGISFFHQKPNPRV